MDAMPAAGGTSFLDIRSRPVPPSEGFPQDMPSDSKPALEEKKADEEYTPSEPRPADEPAPQQSDRQDLSASSTSMGRMELESERDRKRSIKSYEFFERRKKERGAKRVERERTAAFGRLAFERGVGDSGGAGI